MLNVRRPLFVLNQAAELLFLQELQQPLFVLNQAAELLFLQGQRQRLPPEHQQLVEEVRVLLQHQELNQGMITIIIMFIMAVITIMLRILAMVIVIIITIVFLMLGVGLHILTIPIDLFVTAIMQTDFLIQC